MPECTNCTGEPQVPVIEKPDSTKPDTTEPETPVQDTTCPAKGFQQVSICVPVTVTPFAHCGKTVTRCCGNPKVVSDDKPCPGTKNGACTFKISQTICVEVPVDFGARAQVGDTFVECLGASADDICTKCGGKEITE